MKVLTVIAEKPLTKGQIDKFARRVFTNYPGEIHKIVFRGNEIEVAFAPGVKVVGNPIPLIAYGIVGLATIIGVTALVWYVKEKAMPTIPEWVPPAVFLGLFTFMMYAIAKVGGK